MKTIAQTQEKVVHGTGWELSLNKTYWLLVWWIWKDRKATMATITMAPAEMRIMIGSSGREQLVQCEHPHDSL
eukprot:11365803-Ditylum_brightwellii.AAC.1